MSGKAYKDLNSTTNMTESPIPTVLVIDDNEDMTEMLCDYFDTQNINCKIINDSKKGLEELRKEGEKYALILLDLAMPEFSGYDVFNELKKDNLLSSRNIIIFTASAVTDSEIQELLNTGAKGVIKKPISLDELDELVQNTVKSTLKDREN
jgi:DNA-binding response OmpR family regulator